MGLGHSNSSSNGSMTGGWLSRGPIMLILAAGTSLTSTLAYFSLSGLVDSSDDLEDESQSNAIQIAVLLCRGWLLTSAFIGLLAVRGVLQSHLPSLRIFALHSLIDTVLAALVVFVFALVAFSGSISQSLGHAVCEHISRGDAWGLVTSPGSGLELCEERWNYGLAPLLLLLGGIALFIRTKTALFIYDFYKRTATEGKISLESPSATSLLCRSSSEGRYSTSSNYDDHHLHHHHHRSQQHHQSSRSRTSTTSSASKHSRTSSSSTVRPFRSATASRIMLLPVDYQSPPQTGLPSSQFPSLRVIPPSPYISSNSSCDSIDTVKGGLSTSSPHPSASTSRKRSMSHDSGSNPYNHVVVYAPVLMSIEEAQQLGGKEAVIASSTSSVNAAAISSGICSSPTNYQNNSGASPRLRNLSPPAPHQHPHQSQQQFQQTIHDDTSSHGYRDEKSASRPTNPRPSRSDSEGSNMTIVDRTPVVPPSNTNATYPFASIKGYPESTEMDDLAASAAKTL